MPVNIGRRELIAALGVATAWPLMARAQQPAMPVIGFLDGESHRYAPYLIGLRQGLKGAGYKLANLPVQQSTSVELVIEQ